MKKLSEWINHFDNMDKEEIANSKQVLTPDQAFIFKDIFSKYKSGIRYAVLDSASGCGKALRASEKVLTPDGWVEIQTLKVNNYVIGSNGLPTKVVGVYPQGVRDIYRVTFVDGTTVDCDIEHIWRVKEGRSFKNITTKKMLEKGIVRERFDKRYGTIQTCSKFFIPYSSGVLCGKDDNILIDAYLLGLLLGDGGLNQNVIKFSNASENIINEVEKRLPSDCAIGQRYYHNNAWHISIVHKYKKTKNINSLRQALEKYGLFGKKSIRKHIPAEYKTATLETRIQLLQGLIDTDGYVKDGILAEYSTSSEELAKDFYEVANSVGMRLGKIISRLPKYTYKGEVKTGQVSFRIRERTDRSKGKGIVSIEKICSDNAVCIKVDAEDELFVANGYNLTHNTTLVRAMQKYAKSNNILLDVTASTGKAASAIGGKTIHSYLGLKMIANDDAESKDEALVLTTEIGDNIAIPDILIIDESSLVGKKLFNAIDMAGFPFVFFVLDSSQLPPVKEKVMDWNSITPLQYKLTKTLRAKESRMMKLFEDFRDYKEGRIDKLSLIDYVNNENIVHLKWEDADYIPPNSECGVVGYRNKLVEMLVSELSHIDHTMYNLNTGVSATMMIAMEDTPNADGYYKREFTDKHLYYNGEDVEIIKLQSETQAIVNNGYCYHNGRKISMNKNGKGLLVSAPMNSKIPYGAKEPIEPKIFISFPPDEVLVKTTLACINGEHYILLWDGTEDEYNNILDYYFTKLLPHLQIVQTIKKFRKNNATDISRLDYDIKHKLVTLTRSEFEIWFNDHKATQSRKKAWQEFLSANKVVSARKTTARTIHKSQGISIPAIVLTDSSFYGASLSAQYVAATRGKHGLILISGVPEHWKTKETDEEDYK